MIIVFGVLQLLACMAILVVEYNRRSVSFFFWGMICVIFALPHAMDIVFCTYSYSEGTMVAASLFVLLFCLVYAVTRNIRLKNPTGVNPAKGALELKPGDSTYGDIREYIAVMVAIVFAFGVTLFSSVNFGGLGNATWGNIYAAQDGLATPLFALAPYLFASIGGAVVIFWNKRKWLPLLALIGACALFLLITRNRIIMLSFVCPLCLLVASRIKRMSIRTAFLGFILVVLVLYLVYAILVFRHAGTVSVFFSSYSLETFNKEVFSSMLSGEGELGLRNIFYFFIEGGNNFEGFSEGATYLRMLLFWLPSGLSQGIKPDDFAITMASAYMGNPFNNTYSVHPTFFGDAFANFGFLGFLIGVFWGIVMNCFDVWLAKVSYENKVYLVSAWAYAFVIIGRGSVYNGTMIGIVASVVILSSSLLISAFRDGKDSRIGGRSPRSKAGVR